MAHKQRVRLSAANRVGMFCIAAVVIVLVVALVYQSMGLRKKNASYREGIQQAQEQIAAEQERAADLEKLPEYTRTDEYIEKTAREKFGLVYPGEVIFKADND